MQIDTIEVFLVKVPLRTPFRFADTLLDMFETVVVRMESGGVVGWGEVFSGNEPILTASWSRGVFACLRDSLVPRLPRGVAIDSAEKLDERLAPIKGNRHAKAVLNLAYLDLLGRITNKPLYQLLGGTRTKIEVGRTLDRTDDRKAFMDEIASIVSDGYKRLSLKMRPGWDIAMVQAVRGEFPTLTLQGDLEGALSLDRNSETIYRCDDFFLAFLEQPLSSSDFVGHAMIGDTLRTSIALDESITTLHQAEMAIDLRSADVFCLKSGKMGGATTAAAIGAMAQAAGLDCYSGFELGTSLAHRASLALAAHPSCVLCADYVPLEELLAFDLAEPVATRLEEGVRIVDLNSDAGLGCTPNESLIRENALATFGN
ncbi:MAG: enolase C-terminal domain-like protein [Thermoguttaceae bacterium]